MIILFGPAGSGKSVQGQLMAARHDWRWLSSGQMLRDDHTKSVIGEMNKGELVDDELMNQVVADRLSQSSEIDKVILDGYPRTADQTEWLLNNINSHGRSVDLVVVLDVPAEELNRRLGIRGRKDDSLKVRQHRQQEYDQTILPALDIFKRNNVPVVNIDGTGTVGQVHDRIQAVLSKHNLTESTDV